MKIIKGVATHRQKEVIDWSYQYFKDITSKYYFKAILEDETNWNISALLLDDEEKIKGVYLLGNNQLSSIVDCEKYNNLKGVEGVVLTVAEEIRGQGWGNQLKDFPKSLEVDYVWGQQFKHLNNLEDWLKRRELVLETDFIYITAEVFKK